MDNKKCLLRVFCVSRDNIHNKYSLPTHLRDTGFFVSQRQPAVGPSPNEVDPFPPVSGPPHPRSDRPTRPPDLNSRRSESGHPRVGGWPSHHSYTARHLDPPIRRIRYGDTAIRWKCHAYSSLPSACIGVRYDTTQYGPCPIPVEKRRTS